ncbi:energy transducer TonB [Pseudoxanthomonas sp. SORGH_AS_0997]|uniref:Energy transducer TonB n=1 Tax=Pseudoxanthomonas winnipegensis TaxID=2480810 RepID=A0AAW8GFP0_9GAMM|nr:energy transducer TonB [Pseudoxanthomonas sp. SORGH_AS_0997]MDQ1121326.1 hypothetical protein [Pseudoxanthomonas winnipegensis]MDR6139211.1 hypothetical protein [Pseudoxanthomonas sp. SORGH_AS_0997]
MRITVRLAAFLCSALLATVGNAAFAQTRGEVRDTLESSLVVTGDIRIASDGKVKAFQIDRPDKLSGDVTQLIDRAVPSWEFEPILVEGKPAEVRSRMRIRLVAYKREDGNYVLSIRSASFTGDQDEEVDATWLKQQKMPPPAYPAVAAASNVSGTVFLLIKVGADGKVQQAFAEQTNLRVLANGREMARWRKVLEQSAIAATRAWQFTPSANDPKHPEGGWTSRVPIDYSLARQRPGYGTWEPYIPGPHMPAPWLRPELARAQDVDAAQSGTLAPVGEGAIRLRTDLGQG